MTYQQLQRIAHVQHFLQISGGSFCEHVYPDGEAALSVRAPWGEMEWGVGPRIEVWNECAKFLAKTNPVVLQS